MSKTIAFSLAATILWGFWGIGAKLATDRIGPWHSALIYSCISFLTILMIFLLSGSSLRNMLPRGVWITVVAGILGGFAVCAYQMALSTGSLSTSNHL